MNMMIQLKEHVATLSTVLPRTVTLDEGERWRGRGGGGGSDEGCKYQ